METTELLVAVDDDCEDFWQPFLTGTGPAGAYCVSLEDSHRGALRDAVFQRLGAPAGSFTLTARAWAVRGTVRALPGVYDGGVQITKQLVLSGWNAVIDASSSPFGNGVQIVGPGGSGSTVKGFEIENAKFEGILVGTAPVAPGTSDGTPVTGGAPVSDVKILDNALVNNDTGFGTVAGQCFSTPQAPGDCGETIHLVSVTDSRIEGNVVAHNAGGILMTDEFGPTSGNVVRGRSTTPMTAGSPSRVTTRPPSIRPPACRPARPACSTTSSRATSPTTTASPDRAPAFCSAAAPPMPACTAT